MGNAAAVADGIERRSRGSAGHGYKSSTSVGARSIAVPTRSRSHAAYSNRGGSGAGAFSRSQAPQGVRNRDGDRSRALRAPTLKRHSSASHAPELAHRSRALLLGMGTTGSGVGAASGGVAGPVSSKNKLMSKHASSKVVCDRCDKNHPTEECPYFRKARENHPDALRRKAHAIGGGGGNFTLRHARVVRQPGDGSCLFHSLCHGLQGSGRRSGGGFSAHSLRREIAEFIRANPNLEIAGDPLKDWVQWDSGKSVAQYARSMASGGWGGGIEMAAFSRLKRVNVHVYERLSRGSGFKRISCFDSSKAKGKTVHVLYCGGIHYDALVPTESSRM